MTMNRVVGVLGALLLASGQTAIAQIPGIDVHLGLRAGWFTPIGIVGEDASERESKVSQGFAFGGSIELDLPASPINIRANVDATLGRSIEVEGLEVPGTEIDIMAFTGDLVFRPLPRLAMTQPYLLLGAGIKRYSTDGTFEDENEFTGHLGAGADMRVGSLALIVEISDYISSFNEVPSGDSRLQNDLFIMAGIRFSLF